MKIKHLIALLQKTNDPEATIGIGTRCLPICTHLFRGDPQRHARGKYRYGIETASIVKATHPLPWTVRDMGHGGLYIEDANGCIVID